MKKCRVFVPFGAIGAGISDAAFQRGVDLLPDVISTDAGSTDSGPYYLGTGTSKYARAAVKRDLRLLMAVQKERGIPITVGSVGTCGTDAGVDEFADICKELADELDYHPKIAKIYTELDPAVLEKLYDAGNIKPLFGAPEIHRDTFASCSHIVGLAGIEPFVEALSHGADIVICGRCTDTAIIAAYPIMMGCSPAASWHAAKVMECGCQCTTTPVEGGVFAEIDEVGFTIEATSPESSCSAYSISAHLLYENADPIHLNEPGVRVDFTNSTYTELDGGKVRVEGTVLEQVPYTVKLEGSGLAGYQTVILVGICDKDIMAAPEKWSRQLQAYGQDKLDKLGFPKDSYSYKMSIYGYNAICGAKVPDGYIPTEVLMMLRITAASQELATQVSKVFNPLMLHFPARRNEQLPSFAFPFSPAHIERGAIYAFKLYHVISNAGPLEYVRIDYEF